MLTTFPRDYKLRPLLDPNFLAAYTLNRKLSVDEAMVGFIGKAVLPTAPAQEAHQVGNEG